MLEIPVPSPPRTVADMKRGQLEPSSKDVIFTHGRVEEVGPPKPFSSQRTINKSYKSDPEVFRLLHSWFTLL